MFGEYKVSVSFRDQRCYYVLFMRDLVSNGNIAGLPQVLKPS